MKCLIIFLIEMLEMVVSTLFIACLIVLFVTISTLDELKSSVHFTDRVRKRVVRRASHSFRKGIRDQWMS